MARPSRLKLAVWSPCNRFIAITCDGIRMMDILDSVTLQQLQTLELPQGVPTELRTPVFSPDSRILTCSGYAYGDPPDGELFVVSWDLQTGGVANVIRWPAHIMMGTPSMAYSANGKMFGVYCPSGYIFVCDVAGVLVHSYSHKNTIPLGEHSIWAHGESLRFATANITTTTITIWEVGFTSGATPMEIEILPGPDGLGSEWRTALFLPASCRLALFHGMGRRILVWDVRNSRSLLEVSNADFWSGMAFSSNGRFFACPTRGPDVYLRKDSSDGYVLHGILTSSPGHSKPLFTRNGESIVAFSGCAIQLWRTKGLITSPLGISTRVPQHAEDFILEFSPDGMLAVVAMQEDNMVVVLSLKSGIPQLTIDPSMKVYGLGVIGNTVVVIGSPKVVAWNLPAGDCVPNALVGLEDRSWTINLRGSQNYRVFHASISPDSRYIALISRWTLNIHRTSTGERLGERPAGFYTPRFSPDGRNVWCTINYLGGVGVWRVGGGREVLECLGNPVDMEHPPRGNPWGSSCGYRVTNDWWVVGPDGKRLLMLPPPWRSFMMRRLWKGEFLALVHGGLPEPVILAFDVNRDLYT